MSRLSAKLLLLCAFAAAAGAQSVQISTPPLFSDPQAAAKQAFADLKTIVSGSKLEFGLKPEECNRAHLEKPIALYSADLDQLAAYSADRDPSSVLYNTHQIIFPISVDGETKASVEIVEQNGKWHARGSGDDNLAVNLSRTLAKVRAGKKAEMKLIEMHLVHNYFLGWSTESDLTLTPVFDDPDRKLYSGSHLSGRAFFAGLADEARKENARIEKEGIKPD